MQPTDSDLLREYAGRASEAAFAELVSRYVGLVFSTALRITVNRQLAEDVTQTTFAILAREARHLVGRAALASWLHRTASNQAAKLVRGEIRRRAREQEAHAMHMESEGIEADWKQIAPRLDAALNQLAEGDRVVLLLRYFERKSMTEIGAVLDVSGVVAQKRVSRALERLRAALATGGITISSHGLASIVATQAAAPVPAGLAASVSASAIAGGAATAGLSFTTLKFIVMSKLKIGVLGALFIAGSATPYALQRQDLVRIERENQTLRQQSDTARAEKDDLIRQLARLTASDAAASATAEVRAVGPAGRETRAGVAPVVAGFGSGLMNPLMLDTNEVVAINPGMRAAIARMTEAERAEYMPMFEHLGLNREKAEAAMRGIESIHVKANLAQTALLDLSRARATHDELMKKELGPEAHAEYIRLQRLRKVRTEMEMIRQFTAQNHVSADEYFPAIQEAIGSTWAITTHPTHGPYDGIPQPAARGEEILPVLKAEREQLIAGRDALLRQIAEQVPAPVLGQIRSYYDSKVDTYDQRTREIEATTGMTEEEKVQYMMRKSGLKVP